MKFIFAPSIKKNCLCQNTDSKMKFIFCKAKIIKIYLVSNTESSSLCPILERPQMTRQNRIYLLTFISTILMTFLTGCFMGAGTHGSIKGYLYSCSKDSLQTAVMTIINNNPNITRDTSLDNLGSSPLLDSSECYNCPAGDNFYNDIKHYLTIKIKSGQQENEYIFRFAGDKSYWKTSKTSTIFISYAYDKDSNGGSDGNGGINWKNRDLKKNLTDVFETELVNNIDKQLNLTHKDLE